MGTARVMWGRRGGKGRGRQREAEGERDREVDQASRGSGGAKGRLAAPRFFFCGALAAAASRGLVQLCTQARGSRAPPCVGPGDGGPRGQPAWTGPQTAHVGPVRPRTRSGASRLLGPRSRRQPIRGRPRRRFAEHSERGSADRFVRDRGRLRGSRSNSALPRDACARHHLHGRRLRQEGASVRAAAQGWQQAPCYAPRSLRFLCGRIAASRSRGQPGKDCGSALGRQAAAGNLRATGFDRRCVSKPRRRRERRPCVRAFANSSVGTGCGRKLRPASAGKGGAAGGAESAGERAD